MSVLGTTSGTSRRRLRSCRASSPNDSGAASRASPTSCASCTLPGGTMSVAVRSRAMSRATGSTPRTGRIAPSNASSPTAATCRTQSAGIWPVATSTPNAIGRSNPVPSFFRSAGARLTVVRRAGSENPELTIAAETRSRLSFTAPAGSPTTLNQGSPWAQSTSTDTSYASMPITAAERIVASTRRAYAVLARTPTSFPCFPNRCLPFVTGDTPRQSLEKSRTSRHESAAPQSSRAVISPAAAASAQAAPSDLVARLRRRRRAVRLRLQASRARHDRRH